MLSPKNFLQSITNKLILINVIIFIINSIFLFIFKNDLIKYVALQPASIISGNYLWTLLTSMFIHISFWHLVVNMISFYFIGNFVEKIIGGKRVLFLYLVSGLFAGIFWVLVSFFLGNGFFIKIFGDSIVYGVGASGALFGFVGVLAILTPKTKVYMIMGPIIAIILEYVLIGILPEESIILNFLNILISIYFFIAVISMLNFSGNFKKITLPVELKMWMLPIISILPLIIIGIFINLPIGNMAHLGGLIFGIIFALVLKKKYPKKTKMIEKKFTN